MKKIELQPHQIIDDRYKIIERLGQGGMGAVWKASDSRTNDSLVVLKMPLDYQNPEMLKRFGVEAKSMRELAGGCVNILDIQDIGSVPVGEIDNVPYYVTRFQANGALSDWKCPADESGQPIYSRESFSWLNGVTDALEYLHHPDRNVFHRDVKPPNILFNAGGTPLLSDFGIVKDKGLNTVDSRVVTDPGMSIGTPQYMAPEILRNKEYTSQADQYSLAVTIYESIAGALPYQGSNLFVLRDAFDEGHQKLDQLPGNFPATASQAIDRALSQKPADRFDSCKEFTKAFLRGLPSEEDRANKPSEVPTGINVGGTGGGTDSPPILGGRPVDLPGSGGAGSRSGGNLFGGDEGVIPKAPVKPRPGSAGGVLKPAVIGGAVVLVLLGLIGGGLCLSGVFSDTGSKDQPTGISPGSSADSSSSSPATTPISFELAQNIFNGTGGESTDKSRAVSMLEELAYGGSLESQKRLGEIYSKGELGEVDLEGAFKWLLIAAEQGDPRSQFEIAETYLRANQRQEAVKWHLQAANQGDAFSQERLGFFYDIGIGVEKDEAEGARWYRKAAASLEKFALKGNIEAQMLLARIYEEGRGVEKSDLEAIKWYRKAADRGEKRAFSSLALVYRYHDGVKDGRESAYWYKRLAAEDDDGFAELQLGELYEEGQLVEQDLALAEKWYRRAEELGNTEAKRRLPFLFGNLAPELRSWDTDDGEFQLSDYRGKVVWLTFWTRA